RGRRRGCRPSVPAGGQRRPGVAGADAGGAGRVLRLVVGPAKDLFRQGLTCLLSLACGKGPRGFSARLVKVGTGTAFSTTFLNRSPARGRGQKSPRMQWIGRRTEVRIHPPVHGTTGVLL